MKAPAISVVVPTFNRAGSLMRLLAALRDQDAEGIRYEVLIVDNGSTDETAAIVERAALRDPRVQFLREPRQGASYARNAGIARAAAPIVAFVDDDVVPARDWMLAVKRAFDAHPEADCIGGRVEPRWPPHVPRWLDRRQLSASGSSDGSSGSTLRARTRAGQASACRSHAGSPKRTAAR